MQDTTKVGTFEVRTTTAEQWQRGRKVGKTLTMKRENFRLGNVKDAKLRKK